MMDFKQLEPPLPNTLYLVTREDAPLTNTLFTSKTQAEDFASHYSSLTVRPMHVIEGEWSMVHVLEGQLGMALCLSRDFKEPELHIDHCFPFVLSLYDKSGAVATRLQYYCGVAEGQLECVDSDVRVPKPLSPAIVKAVIATMKKHCSPDGMWRILLEQIEEDLSD